MAVVKEMTTEKGVAIKFHDDAYADISPEEQERRWKQVEKIASEIIYGEHIRRDARYGEKAV